MAFDEMTAQLVRENEKLRAACADLLSVRDQFAKAAMQGMWASDQPGYECSGKPEALLQRAETAYAQADAMLQVRNAGVAAVEPAGILPQLARAVVASEAGHDPLCMAILRGKACTCGLDERNAGVAAVALPEPDCWAILTPNGSRLVPPAEAKGRNDAYRLFSEEQVRQLLRAPGVPAVVKEQQR